MKPIGVFYATREGHTGRIAEHVAARLRRHGFLANVRNLHDRGANINLNEYAAAVLAASVHTGRHESEMVKFVRSHAVQLEQLPAAFLSVSLSEAGAERSDATAEEHARFAADVQMMLEHFFKQTGWHPEQVKPVAGALLYTKYNFLIRYVMKRIAKKAGAATDTSHDFEYTDWRGLDRFVDDFLENVERRPLPQSDPGASAGAH